MTGNKNRELTGRIILVREDRFRMVDETGKGYLLTLSNKADIEPEDLKRFKEAGATILVRFEGEPNLISGVAYSVEPL